MKKIIYIPAILLGILFFSNCEEDKVEIKTTIVGFESNYNGLDHLVDLSDPNTSTLEIAVYTNDITSSDRTFNIYVSEESTAIPSNYSLPSSVIIPSGTNKGTIILDAQAVDGQLIIGIESGKGIIPAPELTINIIKFCSSDLAGTYSVVSNGTSTDGNPVNNPLVNLSYEVEITKTGELSYSISDGVAGVYQDWYCGPYGYCFETPGNFSDACGVLSGSWVEAFDSTITLSGTNNYDGTLTISWINGYGDTATAVYTKL